MRMRFCASVVALALLSSAVPGQGGIAGEPKHPAVEQGRLTVRTPDGHQWRLRVVLDGTVAKGSAPTSVKVVAALAGAVVVVDTYHSKSAGMNLCQAGEESFLRVIRTANGRATETFHEKLASCRDNIELGSPGLHWLAETQTLEVDWLSAPERAGQGGKQVLKVGTDARVQTVDSRD